LRTLGLHGNNTLKISTSDLTLTIWRVAHALAIALIVPKLSDAVLSSGWMAQL
jgi:hypothetical protein